MSLTRDDIVIGKKYKFDYHSKNDRVIELIGKATHIKGDTVTIKVVKKYPGYYGEDKKSTATIEKDYVVKVESLKEV